MHEATGAARNFGASASLDSTETSHLAIVVEELATNFYEHSGAGVDALIAIELRAVPDELILTMVDTGPPFDPRSIALDNEVPDRGGGAGLKLVRSWASTIDYRQDSGGNRLTVRLPRHRS